VVVGPSARRIGPAPADRWTTTQPNGPSCFGSLSNDRWIRPFWLWASVHRSWARNLGDLTGKRSALGDATVAPASEDCTQLTLAAINHRCALATDPRLMRAGQLSRLVPGSPGSALL
jgi:hypothetical protein